MFIVNKDKTKIYKLGEYKTPVEANWALEHIMSRIVSQKPLIEMPR